MSLRADGWLLLAGALALASAGCWADPGPRSDERFALLAVGDTGLPRDSHDGQRQVARALAFEDAERPVEGLVLLGDNFYPRGLERGDLALRIGLNLVSPYCRFLVLGPRADETAATCSPAGRPARSIWAVLGNHDYLTRESPELQRTTVVEFIANWRMNQAVAEVHQAAPGVSLILVDSKLLRRDPSVLTDVVASAPGPWRILVSHIPLVPGLSEPEGGAVRAANEAIERSGVPVQLALAGHEHNLQAFVLIEAPRLSVIAGGGSSSRGVHPGPASRVFARETRGFARVAVLETEPERLRVELIAAPAFSWPGGPPVRRIASYEVSLAGQVTARDGSRVSP